jgi:hypothetical protein
MTKPTPLEPVDEAGFATLVADIDLLLGVDAPAAEHLGMADARGRIEDTGVELLAGRAFVRGFSGWLRLDSPDGRGAICFEAGRPVDIVFVNMPTATRAAATPAVVERWFFALASFRTGTYVFEPPDADLTPHRTHALRHPAVLANEVLLRRTADRAGAQTLTRWLGSENNRFRLCQPVASTLLGEALVPVWEPALRGALRLFDGARSFRDIVRGSQQPAEHLLRAAYVLFCFGALEPASLDAAAGEPSADLELRTDGARIEALFALCEASDYFTFLGVDATASGTEIQAAAARLAREIDAQESTGSLHPDVAVATGQQRAAIAAVLAEARRILGDAELRDRYRDGLRSSES